MFKKIIIALFVLLGLEFSLILISSNIDNRDFPYESNAALRKTK